MGTTWEDGIDELFSASWDEDTAFLLDAVGGEVVLASTDGEHGGSVSNESTVEAQTPSPQANSKKRKDAKPPRSVDTRARMKQEMAELREEAESLSWQLESLRQKPKSNALSLVESPWEQIARHQQEAKLRAQTENTKLRAVLDQQLKMTSAFAQLIHKRSYQVMLDDALLTVRPIELTRKIESVASDVRQKRLEKRCDEALAFLRARGFAIPETNLEERVVQEDSGDSVTIEFTYSRVFPFKFATTCRAFRTCTSSSYVKFNDGYYKRTDSHEDVLNGEFEIAMHLRHATFGFHMQTALRSLTEGDHEVHVWDSVSQLRARTPTASLLEGLEFADFGWTYIKRLPDANGPRTIVYTHHCLRPSGQALILFKSHMNELIEALIACRARIRDEIYQGVEDVLMQV
ncbi:hypothetical protein Poli38472_004850 [Pythium oligandrum]|uniref:Uncharacterized protein n=1 Tax=Pythium oligandrum TaxID=41045 RepID=A0A8K1CAL4_PYTOL|nr:hypothetical protein Poli38472_004850 [Pythium oligandrum]|eukprot:TMW59781.1 hypothetical protein Poli38472_004850 [Pythium oligandrum]